ncbi:MAG: glycoside hydrolase family 3 C-terminal domain-containing protein [Oscillospiraceae bacterium]|nr:glycoside hydrolase family 3 C-terminal domain-containing protein [Oscillospiraceae bacterium]
MNKARLMKIREIVGKMSLTEKARICSGADFWNTEALVRLGIPSISMADGPHGLRKEIKKGGGNLGESYPSTCFPTAALLACSFDRELLNAVGLAIGAECSSRDISLLLGPGMNIKRSPLCGRNFEYFSEDPYLSGELAVSYVNGVQSNGVGACVKHFALNNQESKRFISNSCVDRKAMEEIYLEAFRKVVEQAQPRAVMTSYNMVNNEYVSESKQLLQKKLREEWGFSGITISDWGGINNRVAAVEAGLDIEMPGKTSDTTSEIIAAVRSKKLSTDALNQSVIRILYTIDELVRDKKIISEIDYEIHHILARRAAASSIVLMKNNEALLPFDDNQPFTVIGYYAKHHRIQGIGSSRVNPTKVVSLLDELDSFKIPYEFSLGYNADGTTNDMLIDTARKAIEATGRAIVVVALPDSYESEGFDRVNMRFPDGMLKLIDQLIVSCDNIAVVLMSGSPVELPFEDRVKSILCCYLGGQAIGPALADVITGRVTPGGKLPESWPKRLSDVPCYSYFSQSSSNKNAEYREGIYVGYRFYDTIGIAPLFCFGHGISYTEFLYDQLVIDRDTINEWTRVRLSLKVENIGSVKGSETVQLYIGKKGEKYKQLKGFQKVYLLPGENRFITFNLSPRDFTYYNTETERQELETGSYEIYLASSSRDIRLTTEVMVEPRRSISKPEYINHEQAISLPDQTFYDMLGFVPVEPNWRPLTLNSTVFELSHTIGGRLIASNLKNAYFSTLPADTDEATKRMFEESLNDMPIRALSALSGGMLPKNTAIALVHFANHRLISGLIRLIRSKR